MLVIDDTFRSIIHLPLFRSLTVFLLETSDSGTFSCAATSLLGAKSPAAKYMLDIRNPEDLLVGELKFHGGHHNISTEVGKEARWVFKVEMRPQEGSSILWTGPEGQEVPHTSMTRYTQTIDLSTTQVTLSISNVSVADVGPYPLLLTVRGANQSLTQTETLYLKEGIA